VVFHRVIDGFMAQTGDVQYGKAGGDLSHGRAWAASTCRTSRPNSRHVSFQRGVVGMARSQSDPDSANSQFFIMFAPGDFLDGQYTVVGHVVEGMEVVDAIKRGDPDLNGAVVDPDKMINVVVTDK
jgi:peptidylprolyl isomerase